MNYCDYFTLRNIIFLQKEEPFRKIELLNKVLCNLLVKIIIVVPIHHMFCVNNCGMNMNF
jgi:hypothetical protein